jgi:hypothetical protein
VDVHEISHTERTLEEVFFEMTASPGPESVPAEEAVR